jgi:hypothetical protein
VGFVNFRVTFSPWVVFENLSSSLGSRIGLAGLSMVVADEAVSDTGGVIGTGFTLLSVLFSASGSMVATAAAADAAVDESVGTEMFSDGADSGTGIEHEIHEV